MITSLYIFDFDGTLMGTPLPDDGKIKWSDFYDTPYPHKGWWGRSESLDPDVFDVNPVNGITKSYLSAKSDPEGRVIMLTSRMSKLKDLIIFHLDKNNFKFDEYKFKWHGKEKPDQINEMLLKYPTVNYVEVWDDRDKEILLYREWKPVRDIQLKINQVDGRSKE